MKEITIDQIGNLDCFHIAGTSKPGSSRKEGPSGNLAKTIRCLKTSDDASCLKYIKMFLDHRNDKEDGYYHCPLSEIDEAIAKATEYVDGLKVVHEAESYKELQPNEILLDPDEEVLRTYRALREAKREEFLIKSRIELLEGSLKAAIKDHLGIRGIATWKSFSATRVDSKILKEKFPDVYKECTKPTTCRRFSLH